MKKERASFPKYFYSLLPAIFLQTFPFTGRRGIPVIDDFLVFLDPRTVVFFSLFLIFFTLINFSFLRVFRQGRTPAAVISLSATFLILYGMFRFGWIDQIYSTFGLQSFLIPALIASLILLFVAAFQYGIPGFLIASGGALTLLSFTDFIPDAQKGFALTLGIFLLLIGLLLLFAKKPQQQWPSERGMQPQPIQQHYQQSYPFPAYVPQPPQLPPKQIPWPPRPAPQPSIPQRLPPQRPPPKQPQMPLQTRPTVIPPRRGLPAPPLRRLLPPPPPRPQQPPRPPQVPPQYGRGPFPESPQPRPINIPPGQRGLPAPPQHLLLPPPQQIPRPPRQVPPQAFPVKRALQTPRIAGYLPAPTKKIIQLRKQWEAQQRTAREERRKREQYVRQAQIKIKAETKRQQEMLKRQREKEGLRKPRRRKIRDITPIFPVREKVGRPI
jgi:hypothetical protein